MTPETIADTSSSDLADQLVKLLKDYLAGKATDNLRLAADIVCELRSRARLDDGRTDWSGRSSWYRSVISDVYVTIGIYGAERDRLQSALRYHLSEAIHKRAPADEIQASGMIAKAPKQRVKDYRLAIRAMRESAIPRSQVAVLARHASAILDYIDVSAIGDMSADDLATASRHLESAYDRAHDLLTLIYQIRGVDHADQ